MNAIFEVAPDKVGQVFVPVPRIRMTNHWMIRQILARIPYTTRTIPMRIQ